MRQLFRFPVLIPGLLAASAAAAGAFEVESITLAVSHRVFREYHEEFTVKPGERFYLSDSDYSAEAVEFVPDFAINVETGEVITRSQEPNNPAVHVTVYQDDRQVDQVWAFSGTGAPHFYRDSMLAFVLVDYRPASVPGEAAGADSAAVEIEGAAGADSAAVEAGGDGGVDSVAAGTGEGAAAADSTGTGEGDESGVARTGEAEE